mmetsp:Transcript_75699/g.244971  ORF Transcript_75699/g.244971 Transcript_75699/m.244971 type:complete len:373 (+) Transcript_75699:43-1161(+)
MGHEDVGRGDAHRATGALPAQAHDGCSKQEGPALPHGGSTPADLDYEVDSVSVCGLELCVQRRRTDYFAAVAGELPVEATGVVLWECGVLLADYLGYARWIHSSPDAAADGETGDGASLHPWWMTHPPAPVVPSRFWGDPRRRVLELGGGCGLVTAVLASFGADVVCSDGDPAALLTAKRNCAQAERRYGHGPRGPWGGVDFRQFRWGDEAAARALVRECGPFGFVVGSDLLYGSSSPAGPLLETLAAMAQEPGGSGAEVILAMKNRCADEASAFCGLARRRGLWRVRLAERGDLPAGYEAKSSFFDGEGDGPAYNVVHLTPLRDGPSSVGGSHAKSLCKAHGSPSGPERAELEGRAVLDDVAPPDPKRLRV